jgi:hypothetical protein
MPAAMALFKVALFTTGGDQRCEKKRIVVIRRVSVGLTATLVKFDSLIPH